MHIDMPAGDKPFAIPQHELIVIDTRLLDCTAADELKVAAALGRSRIGKSDLRRRYEMPRTDVGSQIGAPLGLASVIDLLNRIQPLKYLLADLQFRVGSEDTARVHLRRVGDMDIIRYHLLNRDNCAGGIAIHIGPC